MPIDTFDINALGGRLLVATPQIQDDLFSRAVILLCDHRKNGAFGLVINKPSDTAVDTLFQENAVLYDVDASWPFILRGGPVEANRVFIIVAADTPPEDTLPITNGLYLGYSKKLLLAIASKETTEYRIFFGCCGWQPKQLAQEVLRRDWITVPMSKQIVFNTTPRACWQKAGRSIGIDMRSLTMPVRAADI